MDALGQGRDSAYSPAERDWLAGATLVFLISVLVRLLLGLARLHRLG